jgi:hypothetical protein
MFSPISHLDIYDESRHSGSLVDLRLTRDEALLRVEASVFYRDSDLLDRCNRQPDFGVHNDIIIEENRGESARACQRKAAVAGRLAGEKER